MNADLLAQPGLLLGAVLVFALAGVVKGVVGLGLPTVSMALLALFMPPAQAAALLLLPSLVTNVLQMRPAASLGPVLRRLWPMQLGVVVGTLGGVWWWGPLGQAAGARTLLGAALAARYYGIPVLLDGFVCTAAVAPLARLAAGGLDHTRLSHCSAEAGHARLAEKLELVPLLDLGLRLGEASGAALAVPLLRAAVACHNGMATFAQAAVSGRT